MLTILFCLGAGCARQTIKIDIWYGDHQTFGVPGNPQRAVNILGNASGEYPLSRLEYSLNGQDFKPLSTGPDGRRLARKGDFNLELYRHKLLEGRNRLFIRAVDSLGNTSEKEIKISYTSDRVWPLPCYVDWAGPEPSGSPAGIVQDRVCIVDGKWRLEDGRIRTAESYYDRVLALGDSTWTDYEVRTSVIFYDHADPLPGPPTFGVAHAAIALRWPGHNPDGKQPNVKWYPLGATCEFQLSGGLDSCRWRILYGGGAKTEDLSSNRKIELGRLYYMAARVESLAGSRTRYSAKLWANGQPEPDEWDLTGIKDPEDMQGGSALLLSHNTDVSFGKVTITPVPAP